jgi:hypothetical protein
VQPINGIRIERNPKRLNIFIGILLLSAFVARPVLIVF